jgi:hypothetical protein
MLGNLPGDAWHFCRSLCKHVLVASEEVDELTFLFGAQAGPNLDGIGILGSLEGTEHGGHDQVGQRGQCTKAQLL